MAEIFSIAGLSTLAMLILLQAVLGFDNLLYISIESKRAPEDKQQFVRRFGILLAIGLRIALLLLIMSLIQYVAQPLFSVAIPNPLASPQAATDEVAPSPSDHQIDAGQPATEEQTDEPAGAAHGDQAGPLGGAKREWKVGYQERGDMLLSGAFTLHSLITLFGGVFILYTAVKEVLHLLAVHDPTIHADAQQKSTGMVIFWIVLMNLIFSFDSILSAMALTKNFWIMAVAIVISGAAMLFLADYVSEFLKKNRMYEVLGLFILFIVGVMLIGEGGHLAHLQLFTYHVEPMAKSTFYFTLVILVAIDVVQSKYRKKLMAQRERELAGEHAHV